MRKFRIIRSGSMSAERNMALDSSMFNRYLQDGIPTLRLYRWAAPSFTYGVSQDPSGELDLDKCYSDGIGVAKRITGGGVLFHNDEITYSFVCSKEDVGEPTSPLVSYREICEFLLRFYKSLGLKPYFAFESPDFGSKSRPSGICAASYEKYDIMVNGRKMGGNAQKRARSAIFQHGSVPCSIDWALMRRYLKNAPLDAGEGATSLAEEMSAVPDKNMLEEALMNSFGSTFGIEFTVDGTGELREAGMVK